MAEGVYGEPAREMESTLAGQDWYGRDISAERHSRVLFVDLELTEAESDGAVFEECTFRRARFNASVHANTAFVNCTFSSCNFYDAHFTDCKFVGTMFDGCTFDNMQVTGGNWSFVGLPRADLRVATFHRVRMREADLTRARCHGATIREVDLSGASLHGADLSSCDLRGSDLSALDPQRANVKDAIITIDQTIGIAEALGFDVRVE